MVLTLSEIKVSVYCTAYNHGKYIRDCLDGFVKQKTDFKYEVIVHDDASTDDTAKIIKEYADRYPDIIKPIFQKENQYSKGISISQTFIAPILQGEYIAVCEGDDCWIDENKLQKQVDILDKNRSLVACVHQTKLYDCISGRFSVVSPINNTGIIDKVKIFSDCCPLFHTSSLCYRREFLTNKPRFCRISKSVGDYPFGIYLALSGPIYYINEEMSFYRLNTETSWSLKMKNNKDNTSLYREMIQILEIADNESDYKYHDYFRIPILEYKYRCWEKNFEFSVLNDDDLSKLKLSKKIKIFSKKMIKIFLHK